jgi:hypothetical protein
MIVAIQILLTILITSACTYIIATNVDVDDKAVKTKQRFTFILKVLIFIHAILVPGAIINLIWSF